MPRTANMTLPWQYVVLVCWGAGAFLLVPFLLEIHDKDPYLQYNQNWWTYWGAIAFLSVGLGTTPWLIRGGRRRVSVVNSDTPQGWRSPIRITRVWRLAFGVVALAGGIFLTWLSHRNPSGDQYFIYVGMIVSGLATIISTALEKTYL